MPRLLRSALLLVLLTACDDDGIDDDTTCTLSVAVSGDVSAKLPGADGVACLIQHSIGEGIDVEYVALDLPVERVSLDIGVITRGITGDAFPATVRVYSADNDWTAEDCSVSVSEHDYQNAVEFGDAYRVRGTGECPMPLTDDAGTGSVTLAPFEFVVVVTWTN